MEPFSNKPLVGTKMIAGFSLGTGISSLLMFFNPPFGVFLGSCAIILAWWSKIQGRKLSGFSLAGIILGVSGIALSVVIFLNFVAVIRLFDNPEAFIGQFDDPAVRTQIRNMISQYRELINQLR